jgi:maleylacetate reductase
VNIHETSPTRVISGPGARSAIASEAERSDLRSLFLITTPSAAWAADVTASTLGDRLGGRFPHPVVHTPVHVTEEAVALARSCDGLVAIGGGAAIGLSKAIADRTGLPQIAVPTTYAGSEVTPVLGETREGVKVTKRDVTLVPGTVIYDPELTLGLPLGLTLTSALNALAHAVEAMWAPDATMLTDGLASESATAVLTGLPDVLDDPFDVTARGKLQSAAWLAGLCLAQTRMGLHHQLAHVLGGRFDLPHANLHAVLLAHVMRFNLPSAPEAAARLSRITGGNPAEYVAELAGRYDGPRSLAELGVPRAELPEVATTVSARPYPNPRGVEDGAVLDLLEQAWEGRP